jgi:hypothetical protein
MPMHLQGRKDHMLNLTVNESLTCKIFSWSDGYVASVEKDIKEWITNNKGARIVATTQSDGYLTIWYYKA